MDCQNALRIFVTDSGEKQRVEIGGNKIDKAFFGGTTKGLAYMTPDSSGSYSIVGKTVNYVEGFADAVAVAQYTGEITIPVMGTYASVEVTEWVAGQKPAKIVVWRDDDQKLDGSNPGLESSIRICEAFGTHGIPCESRYVEGEDPAEYIPRLHAGEDVGLQTDAPIESDENTIDGDKPVISIDDMIMSQGLDARIRIVTDSLGIRFGQNIQDGEIYGYSPDNDNDSISIESLIPAKTLGLMTDRHRLGIEKSIDQFRSHFPYQMTDALMAALSNLTAAVIPDCKVSRDDVVVKTRNPFSISEVHQHLRALASEGGEINLGQIWLDSLDPWDDEDEASLLRSGWLFDQMYPRAETIEQNPFRHYFHYAPFVHLINAWINPGSRMHVILCYHGKYGCGKGSLSQNILPAPLKHLYCSLAIEKGAAGREEWEMAHRSNYIIEVTEGTGITTALANELKKQADTSTWSSRSKYARTTSRKMRTSSIIITMESSKCMPVATNRRIIPIWLGDEPDSGGHVQGLLEKHRDNCFREAYHCFKNGEMPYYPKELINKKLASVTRKKMMVDEYHRSALKYILEYSKEYYDFHMLTDMHGDPPNLCEHGISVKRGIDWANHYYEVTMSSDDDDDSRRIDKLINHDKTSVWHFKQLLHAFGFDEKSVKMLENREKVSVDAFVPSEEFLQEYEAEGSIELGKKIPTPKNVVSTSDAYSGEMAERTNAASLNLAGDDTSEGSNPSLPASTHGGLL